MSAEVLRPSGEIPRSSGEKLRPSQAAVVAYQGGKMGVAAVPGSGKTFTLSHLAAALVERLAAAGFEGDQEVLIVTFTNPAVNSFRAKIAELVGQERGLLPYVGYRVRTLHGLAHDIVRERPDLAGLSEGFDIVDEQVTNRVIRELSEDWLRRSGDRLLDYVDLPLAESEEQVRYLLRKNGPELVESIAREVIRLGKDNRWTPDIMRAHLDTAPHDLPLAQAGIEIYEDYQRSLGYRGAVDFDDLVRLAMQSLESDPAYLERLRARWPYILEDEAQDSSQLQNEMLRLLSANRNWVRVGDPNQSIYTTFTTANQNLLREFLAERDVDARPMPKSGRSTPAIIALANELVHWSRTDPLVSHLHDALAQQTIEPTDPGDTQRNPENSFIYLDWDPEKNITPENEIERVVRSLEKWLPDHKDWTVAALVPENSRGFKLAEELKERGIAYEELLRSTSATRSAAAKLQAVFDFLANPTNSRTLAALFEGVWWPLLIDDPEDQYASVRATIVDRFADLQYTENFLWPGVDLRRSEYDWLDELSATLDDPFWIDGLSAFRRQAQAWLEAAVLPVDQLILTVAQDLFRPPDGPERSKDREARSQARAQADLALAHKIAVVMRSIADNNPDYRLPELAAELKAIAQNQRRFLGFDDTSTGYKATPGVVTVATMHAAKGLEWDRVYLMAVNNYSFPAAQPGDSYIAEKWFVRDELNLQAEARRQATLLMEGRAEDYEEGTASAEARIEYAAERLRLLYVGITRARKDLVITWNMGRFWKDGHRNQAASALIALHHFWEKQR
jgi:DNA helicase-2/ATP-dependent DNA helicase PcrA